MRQVERKVESPLRPPAVQKNALALLGGMRLSPTLLNFSYYEGREKLVVILTQIICMLDEKAARLLSSGKTNRPEV